MFIIIATYFFTAKIFPRIINSFIIIFLIIRKIKTNFKKQFSKHEVGKKNVKKLS